MKLSIVRTDSKGAVHLSIRPAEWFFERILTDTKAGAIQRIRQYVAEYGDEDLAGLTSSVASVYPSVELTKSANGLLEPVAFNGLVGLHVAGLLREKDVEAVKEAAQMLPMTYAAFLGVDGRSVEILVAVASKAPAPVTESDMDQFCTVAYEAAIDVYSGILPKAVERQLATARYSFPMTQDAQPFFNPSATPLQIGTATLHAATGDKSSAGDGQQEQRETDMSLYAVYEQIYERAASEAHELTSGVIRSQWYEAYLTELSRRLCVKGVPEEEAFLHVRNHHKYKKVYDEDTLRAIVSAVYAEEMPQQSPREEKTVSQDMRRLINFLTTRYVYRYNTVMGFTEYRPNNTWLQDWKPCDENVVNGMTIEARLAGFDVRDKDVRRYVRSNLIRRSDPIDDYLAKVSGKWDGVTDHIGMLARCVPCDVPQWEEWFRKWFVSMVAQWLLPQQDYGNAIVPLLISPQGDGKTSFCRMILPKELRWGFLENLDVGQKRQTLQAMHNFLLINLDEFNQISPKLQEGFLKNVIQLPSVKIKRPYGKHVEEFKRYASFIATTNDQQVLSDPTGSRRFICVQLTAPVRTDYKPNYEGLYGQAYTIITERRMKWYFEPQDLKDVMANNSAFQLVPFTMHLFYEHYDLVEDELQGTWLTVATIFERLRALVGSTLSINSASSLGRILSNIEGIRRKRTKTGIAYLVKEKQQPLP